MFLYTTIILSLILDLWSKYLASTFISEKINILWNFIYLDYVKNYWVAFSINIPFLKIITLILIIWIFVYYFKEEKIKKNKMIDLSFGLILWWAIWNGIERIFNWFVIDFIWVRWFSIFNLADSFIIIWVIIYFYFLFKNK